MEYKAEKLHIQLNQASCNVGFVNDLFLMVQIGEHEEC